ncbi:cation:proton antiporter [candidate division WOR-3 bacterium]|nr:cation:proton antiporter [candidate division WOR-3 bacterium]
MSILGEHDILIFLLELAFLLGAARLAGELCKKIHQPALVGELLVGILFGPTVLGRLIPQETAQLLYVDSSQMLDTVAWLGGFFLLLVIGFDVDIGAIWKRKRSSLTIGIAGVLIPLIMGIGLAFLLPQAYKLLPTGIPSLVPETTEPWIFALFLGTAVAISAIPVIARALHDLDILKSDLGLDILSAFAVNDIIGWAAFTIILGLAVQSRFNWFTLLKVLGGTAVFVGVCLTLGRRFVNWVVLKFNRSRLPKPGIVLTFIFVLGALCGVVTHYIGIHASLGFLLAGMMAGSSHQIKGRSRDIISQLVHAVFVPLFFTNIGIKVNFWENFDLLLVGTVTAVAIGGKFLGAWAGSRFSGIPRQDSVSIGFAHIPGGAMEIIVAYLALEAGIINPPVFEAILVAAIISSVLVGPLLTLSLRLRRGFDAREFLAEDAVLSSLHARTPEEAIAELCEAIARHPGMPRAKASCAAVDLREELMSTGMELGIAIPHARMPELANPVFAFGRSLRGLDWNTPDDLPVKFVFLILTPEPDRKDDQVKILAAIARAWSDPAVREKMLAAEGRDEMLSVFNASLRRDLHRFRGRIGSLR